MTHDTEWPASSPHGSEQPSRTEADRLAWCIRYLADEARRGGFPATAEALEAVAMVGERDSFKKVDKNSIDSQYTSSN